MNRSDIEVTSDKRNSSVKGRLKRAKGSNSRNTIWFLGWLIIYREIVW
ncbi:hypothetical protein OAK16_02880 [Verrucomicrobia bacterium]|nr:hypothetical protein [Verrucomicrobiota bacterium]